MEDDFNLSEMAETIGNESDAGSLSSESDAGQSETNPSGESAKELSLDEITKGLEGKEVEAPKTGDLLSLVNALGMKRGEEAIALKDEKEVAELIQKGFDYTKKTQEHADGVRQKEEAYAQKEKEFSERFAQKEQEFSTIKQEQTILETAIRKLQSSQSEDDKYLLAEIGRIYNETHGEFERNKPYTQEMDNKFKSLSDEIAALKGKKVEEEHANIRTGLEQDLSSFQSKIAPTLQTLKIAPSWEKVKEMWAADATGKMSAENAFMAVHGKEMISAYSSHQKVLEAKAKAQEKLLGRGAGSGMRGVKPDIQTKTDSLGDFLQEAASHM